jgi:hypothetical protein
MGESEMIAATHTTILIIAKRVQAMNSINMNTEIIVALIGVAGSVVVAFLNYSLKRRVRTQEKRAQETTEQVDRQAQQLAEQQQAINTLVAYAMSASIFRHLCGIALLKEYNLDFQEANKRELYFLRDHGFIQPRHGGFVDFVSGTHNVAQMAGPTPIGTAYVRLRKQEIPPEMLANLNNLRENTGTL